MIKVNLANSKSVVLIDDEDLELISKFVWREAKGAQGNSYAVTYIGGNAIRMHNLIMNPPEEFQIDHKNWNGLDNRRENLRICTPQQNSFNQKKRKDTSSKYKGVSWSSQTGKWKSTITHNGKTHYLGRFDSAEEAAQKYDEKAKEFFGEFAVLNFPTR
jgi:hypothetical protein